MEQDSPRYIVPLARELRREQTKAEKLLWSGLRNRQLANAKFRRQHPLGRYIVDFYCDESRLAVELDGSIHEQPNQAGYDRARRRELVQRGIRLLVFKNQEVFADLQSVLTTIRDALTPGAVLGGEGGLPSPPAPLPEGEGGRPSPPAPLPEGEGGW